PANILIEARTGRALVADFGLAKAADCSGLTVTGQVLGTAEYIAPEQALGQPVDRRTDLYALGAVAFHMLSGRLPFQAATTDSLIYQHAFEPPPALEKTAPDIPAGVAVLVKRLLAKDPAQRYQRAAEVLAEVQRLRAGSVVADRDRETAIWVTKDKPFQRFQAAAGSSPPPVEERRERRVTRPRWWPGRLAAVGLAGVVGVVGLLGVAVYRIATDRGELVIEIDDPQVEAILNQQGVTLHDRGAGRKYLVQPGRQPLASGAYEIEMTEPESGLLFSTREFI